MEGCRLGRIIRDIFFVNLFGDELPEASYYHSKLLHLVSLHLPLTIQFVAKSPE